ncbi:MAG TPA: hypothetical protein DCE14_02600 [Kosmotogaceae bacterium]|nr:hypothetical protein [Kosmotogaceae bacterium]
MNRSDVGKICREALLRETAARGVVEQRSLERRDSQNRLKKNRDLTIFVRMPVLPDPSRPAPRGPSWASSTKPR